MGCCSNKARVVDISAVSGRRPGLATLRKNHRAEGDAAGAANSGFGADKNKNPQLRSGKSCLGIMEANAVLVAVRVRPLNEREKTAKSAECLKHDGASNLSLLKTGEKDVTFAFDCVMRQDVGQQDVFDRTGRPLLHKVLEGYNGCLFAYGQTGSGKTWTMQGGTSGASRGVIPLLCNELFAEVAARKQTKIITVLLSSLEIYNEKLKDLLEPANEDLQIREETGAGGRGIFVDGVSETIVNSGAEVLAHVERGQARRAVGQTNMNEHSSRSHAVITFRIAIRDVEDKDGVTQVISKLHLIDLAGSERQKSTGATGDRLKEGAQINLSLSALGNVINALTEPKGKSGRHIPYRDSKLTRLLQDSLGGNSFTVMICNISPAQINYEETLSSLRFAERAKKIENKATINRDPKTALIAELMKENKLLKDTVGRLQGYVADLEKFY